LPRDRRVALEHALKCNISCTSVEKFAAATAVYLAPSQKKPTSQDLVMPRPGLVIFDSSGQVEGVLAAGRRRDRCNGWLVIPS
jgi:hypothetical protein